MLIIFIEGQGYYVVTNNGKTKIRLDELMYNITSEQVPIMITVPATYDDNEVLLTEESIEQKKDENGELVFETKYIATPKEITPETLWGINFELGLWFDMNDAEITEPFKFEEQDVVSSLYQEQVDKYYALGDTANETYFKDKWIEVRDLMNWIKVIK